MFMELFLAGLYGDFENPDLFILKNYFGPRQKCASGILTFVFTAPGRLAGPDSVVESGALLPQRKKPPVNCDEVLSAASVLCVQAD
jgi:hypothetical protein